MSRHEPAAASHGATTLRCATLNVWALPGPFGHAVEPRLRAIADELVHIDADVVAFQEVWTGAARRMLERAGTASGLPYAWSGSGALGGSGLLLLSRWPIGAGRHERFSLPQLPPRLDHPDYYASKGFIEVQLTTPAGPVRLVTTHLQARYGRHVRHEYRAERVGQVIELAMAIDRAREPVVVLGDFNFRESHDEYRVLTGLSHLRDAAAELDARQPTVEAANPFRKSGTQAKRIDYAFVRDGDESGLHVRSAARAFDTKFAVDGESATFSDHAGLVVDLELHDRPTPRLPPASAAADLATAILAQGRARAERTRGDARLAGGAGVATAIAVGAGSRNAVLSRRRLLRTALYTAAVTAFAPGVVYTMRSEVFAPDEIKAYEKLVARLAAVRHRPPEKIA